MSRTPFYGSPPESAVGFSLYQRTNNRTAGGSWKYDRLAATTGAGGVREYTFPISQLTPKFVRSFGAGIFFIKWWGEDDQGRTKALGKGPNFQIDPPSQERSNGADTEPAHDEPAAVDPSAVAEMLGLDARTFLFFEMMDKRAARAAEAEERRARREMDRMRMEFDQSRKRDLDFWTAIEAVKSRSGENEITALAARLEQVVEQLDGEETEPNGADEPWQKTALNETAHIASKLVDVISKKLGDVPIGDDDGDDGDAVDTDGEASPSASD